MRELVARLSVAAEADVPQLCQEMRSLLVEHEQFVRRMATWIACHMKDES
jgi:hypothetical protein